MSIRPASGRVGLRAPRTVAGGIVVDSFVRADASSLGTSETGQAWTDHDNGYSIISNKAAAESNGNRNTVTVTTDHSDVEISAIVTQGAGADSGMLARYGSGNWIHARFTGVAVTIFEATAFSNLGSASYTLGVGSSARMTLRCVGPVITVLVDDVPLLAARSTQNQTAKVHGMWSSDTAARFSDFSITPLDAYGNRV